MIFQPETADGADGEMSLPLVHMFEMTNRTVHLKQ
jgi:hypothetical protein